MTTTQKINLLTRSLWTYAEVREYLDIKTEYRWRDLVKRVEPSGFSRKLYRDNVLKAVGTTVEREVEILKSIRS